MIRIIVSGIFGRMGKELVALIEEDPDAVLAAGYDTGKGQAPVSVEKKTRGLPDDFDVAIDFSSPSGALTILGFCVEQGKALVTGTTGFSKDELEEIKEAGKAIPILMASNMSVGINMVLGILEQVSKSAYNKFDIEIVETHHKMKKDSPSGTAKAIARMISEKSGKKSFIHGREGRELVRKTDEIGIHAVRGGSVVGTHSIFLHGDNESIEITHRAYSRRIFALGALAAAKWVIEQKPGVYSMSDLLS